jgi:carbamoyltransferase
MIKNVYTLGINIGHDRSASIVKDGLLFAHIAQDRIDRIKHSDFYTIPYAAINALLKKFKIKPAQLSAVCVSCCDFQIEALLPELKDDFCSYYKLKDEVFLGINHHLAHAYSVFFTSDFDESLIFVADGSGDAIGEKSDSESVFGAKDKKIIILEKRLQDLQEDIYKNPFLYNYSLMNEKDKKLEISIGKKYEQITNILGFKAFQEGKTMGLAPYGRAILDVRKYQFNGLNFSLKVEDLLKEIHKIKLERGMTYRDFMKHERANIARTVQDFTEHALNSILSALKDKYKYENLCLAGGIFLNCVANHKILKCNIFKKVHIIPSAGDDGQSIGAAFKAYIHLFGMPKCDSSCLPYLGLSYTDSNIQRELENFKLRYQKLKETELAKILAKEIDKGRVVAILRGRSELGPRALCQRSILADPRHSEMKKHLNKCVKFRECFRPYAPVVTWEDQFKFFDLKQESPFMQLAAKVRPEYRNQLRAITHVDKTARVQAIDKKKSSFIYHLLKEFESLTGFPILLNTSFNLSGDPIVESPKDAILTFLSTGIDLLVLENYLIDKNFNQSRISFQIKSTKSLQ